MPTGVLRASKCPHVPVMRPGMPGAVICRARRPPPALVSTFLVVLKRLKSAVILNMKFSINKNRCNSMAVWVGIEPTWRYTFPNPDSNRGRYRFRLTSPRVDWLGDLESNQGLGSQRPASCR